MIIGSLRIENDLLTLIAFINGYIYKSLIHDFNIDYKLEEELRSPPIESLRSDLHWWMSFKVESTRTIYFSL